MQLNLFNKLILSKNVFFKEMTNLCWKVIYDNISLLDEPRKTNRNDQNYNRLLWVWYHYYDYWRAEKMGCIPALFRRQEKISDKIQGLVSTTTTKTKGPR